MTPDCTIKVRSTAELLAVTPYVLGFHPSDSIVLIGMDGAEVTFGARYDLPPPDEDDSAAIAGLVARQRMRSVAVIGYGPPTTVTPAVLRLAHAVAASGIRVDDVLRVTDGRWWSYSCDDPRCCPDEGQPCAPPDNVVATQAIFRGKVALPDRQALVAQVAAVTGTARTAMVAATARAQTRMAGLFGEDPRHRRAGRSVRRAGRVVLQEAERQHLAGRSLTDDEVAWLGVLLVDRMILDDALARSDPEQWRIRLWTDVLRRVEPFHVPAPACLLALAAWQAGNGALARVAVERALGEGPGHPVVGMVDRLLRSGIGPQAVVALRPPLGRGQTRVRPRAEGPHRTGGERQLFRGARRRSW